MKTEKKPDLSDTTKLFVRWFRDGLINTRPLFVAIVSLFITLAERSPRPKKSKEERDTGPLLIDQVNQIDIKSMKKKDYLNSNEDESSNSKQMIGNQIYPFLAVVSTIALITGVSRLGPIAQWAKTQNECIESLSLNEKLSGLDIANKVKSCNGGHD